MIERLLLNGIYISELEGRDHRYLIRASSTIRVQIEATLSDLGSLGIYLVPTRRPLLLVTRLDSHQDIRGVLISILIRLEFIHIDKTSPRYLCRLLASRKMQALAGT